jgi:hypothetical protein
VINVTKVTRLAVTVLMLCLGAVALTAQPADQTASDFYMSYRTAFDKATAVEELLPLMSKAVRAKVEATPKEERAKMFEFLKEMSKMSGVKIVKETKNADGVMLTVEGVQDKEQRVGQIQIVKEDGKWKMGRESWSGKS